MNPILKPTIADLQRYLLTAENVLATVTSKRSLGDDYQIVDDAKYGSWRTQVLNYLKSTLTEKNHYYTGFKSAVREGQCYPNVVKRGISLLESLIEDLRSSILGENIIDIEQTNNSNVSVDTNEVFVVHGHDDLAKVSVARFIEKLGLKAIILHEQHNAGMTIIEKIENYTNVGFAVILYTECDLGGKDANNLQPRARQNVIFEHGYLMAKIGRNKVCALVKGKVETPSDISGVVYTPMDEHGAWHYMLAKELKASGYDIDMNRL